VNVNIPDLKEVKDDNQQSMTFIKTTDNLKSTNFDMNRLGSFQCDFNHSPNDSYKPRA